MKTDLDFYDLLVEYVSDLQDAHDQYLLHSGEIPVRSAGGRYGRGGNLQRLGKKTYDSYYSGTYPVAVPLTPLRTVLCGSIPLLAEGPLPEKPSASNPVFFSPC
jgi:hypothetical protein